MLRNSLCKTWRKRKSETPHQKERNGPSAETKRCDFFLSLFFSPFFDSFSLHQLAAMRRSLAAALLRSACGGSSSIGLGSSSSGLAAAAASVRSISSSIGRFPSSSSSPLAAAVAATTTSLSARNGGASCSQRASPAASSWKISAPFSLCSRRIHTSSGERGC